MFNAWIMAAASRGSAPLFRICTSAGMPRKPHDGAKGASRVSNRYSFGASTVRPADWSRKTERKSFSDPFILSPRHATAHPTSTISNLPDVPIPPWSTRLRAKFARGDRCDAPAGSRESFSAKPGAGRIKKLFVLGLAEGNWLGVQRNRRPRYDRNPRHVPLEISNHAKGYASHRRATGGQHRMLVPSHPSAGTTSRVKSSKLRSQRLRSSQSCATRTSVPKSPTRSRRARSCRTTSGGSPTMSTSFKK
jgi:hypothetical protein